MSIHCTIYCFFSSLSLPPNMQGKLLYGTTLLQDTLRLHLKCFPVVIFMRVVRDVCFRWFFKALSRKRSLSVTSTNVQILTHLLVQKYKYWHLLRQVVVEGIFSGFSQALRILGPVIIIFHSPPLPLPLPPPRPLPPSTQDFTEKKLTCFWLCYVNTNQLPHNTTP